MIFITTVFFYNVGSPLLLGGNFERQNASGDITSPIKNNGDKYGLIKINKYNMLV